MERLVLLTDVAGTLTREHTQHVSNANNTGLRYPSRSLVTKIGASGL
jgi:hypothetical protein